MGKARHDARLAHASASELLKACKAVSEWADRECMPVGGSGDGPWDLVDAAIAKAESE